MLVEDRNETARNGNRTRNLLEIIESPDFWNRVAYMAAAYKIINGACKSLQGVDVNVFSVS